MILIIETSLSFYELKGEKEHKTLGVDNQYLRQSKWQVIQVFIALIVSSLIQLIFPFLTQSIVDTGINTQNLQYITIVLNSSIDAYIQQYYC